MAEGRDAVDVIDTDGLAAVCVEAALDHDC